VTREQLDAIRARATAALNYEKSEYEPEEGAYVSPATEGADTVEVVTCPLCDGDGEVESQRYDCKEVLASTVVAYGIGKGLALAEEWVENGPRDTLALLAEIERLSQERDDAYRRGVQAAIESVETACERWSERAATRIRAELLEEWNGEDITLREYVRSAFRRGVRVMREQASKTAGCTLGACVSCDRCEASEAILRLPDPVDPLKISRLK
jgi:hypothetical protein